MQRRPADCGRHPVSDWVVRTARLEEADMLARLERAAFADKSWGSGAIADSLTAPYVITDFVVAMGDIEPCGFVIWRMLGDEAEILSIGVSPDRQQGGAGSALLASTQSRAQANGADRIFLEVWDGNHSAIALYRKFGFEQIGRRVGYYRGGDDALVMRLKLKN
jgi:ribosomal-protein-alanine N-acetyltransferase